ncbi:dTDP-4-dehydrorhamnose 3,5-epimerase family protein [Streptomyces zingiberis]|uniref:dTDP-4-keto-6-deoxy-D-glucose epimerase n=1 Tax=Streptomyces zingiberis TaxID=2053010 RepID=A0ABX1C1N7_9ACTN|nr:dTDP-4-dehydrorhamnose 3,5-epimerase family protein [Streptomyces zingiberis]NJQ03811.1 dTDP-4-keto-6-deoxy-D-glucose epimerase [Streptomyces zingiberis]
MEARELAVAGALEITPPSFPDPRGLFSPVYQEADWAAVTGGEPFRPVRCALSVNHAGVVRGVHYSRSAPATAKAVLCAAGEALDLVVDVRRGSPTFGRWDAVPLSADRPRAVYCPPGAGHAFVARAEGTVLLYLLSTPYRPAEDGAVSAFDPALGLPVPPLPGAVVSAADRDAPPLAEALGRGLLPVYRPGARPPGAAAPVPGPPMGPPTGPSTRPNGRSAT